MHFKENVELDRDYLLDQYKRQLFYIDKLHVIMDYVQTNRDYRFSLERKQVKQKRTEYWQWYVRYPNGSSRIFGAQETKLLEAIKYIEAYESGEITVNLAIGELVITPDSLGYSVEYVNKMYETAILPLASKDADLLYIYQLEKQESVINHLDSTRELGYTLENMLVASRVSCLYLYQTKDYKASIEPSAYYNNREFWQKFKLTKSFRIKLTIGKIDCTVFPNNLDGTKIAEVKFTI